MHGPGLFITAAAFVCLWSSGWTVSQYAVSDSSALSILSARYIVVVALLLIMVTALRSWQRMSCRELAFHLLIGALCHALYLLGSMRAFELGVSAAIVACINALQPIASASLASVITRERIRKRYCIGFMLGILSVAVVITESYFQSEVSSLVLALPFTTMLALSLGLVLNRRQETQIRTSQQERRPITLLLLLNTVGALIIIVPLAAVSGDLQWQFTRTEWSAIAWLSTVVSLGSYALLLLLLRHNSAVRVSSLTYLVPPVTLLQNYFLFGEALSLTEVSALCIASAAVYVILSKSSLELTHEHNSVNSAGIEKQRLSQESQHVNPRTDIQNKFRPRIDRCARNYLTMLATPLPHVPLRCHSICEDFSHQHCYKLFSFSRRHSRKLSRIDTRQRLRAKRTFTNDVPYAFTNR